VILADPKLAAAFPHLAGDGQAEKTSEDDPCYNCIAWAAGATDRWWWPRDAYWPVGVSEANTLEAFVAAFATLGYEPCESGDLELGEEKIVIYCSSGGAPTHAARQLDDGSWTSKLGEFWDIRHSAPSGVEGPVYGRTRQFMRRPIGVERCRARFRARSRAWYTRFSVATKSP
jgi:hypothetical protein